MDTHDEVAAISFKHAAFPERIERICPWIYLYIRSKVGHDKVIHNFAGGILAVADEKGRILQLRGDKTWAFSWAWRLGRLAHHGRA